MFKVGTYARDMRTYIYNALGGATGFTMGGVKLVPTNRVPPSSDKTVLFYTVGQILNNDSQGGRCDVSPSIILFQTTTSKDLSDNAIDAVIDRLATDVNVALSGSTLEYLFFNSVTFTQGERDLLTVQIDFNGSISANS